MRSIHTYSKNKAKGSAVIAILMMGLTAILTGSYSAEGRSVRTVPKTLQSDPSYPLVGAIRWDFWFKGSPTIQKALSAPRWRYRLPFFAQVHNDGSVHVNGDSQSVVDREIWAAVEGRIDYWAFVYYHNTDYLGKPVSPEILKGNLAMQRYLSSHYRDRLNHALIMQLGYLGTPSQWEQTIDNVIIVHFQMSNYQKVLNNRPLLYMFNMKYWPQLWGTEQKARSMLALIREKSMKAGLGNPYIVLMHFSPREAIQMQQSMGYDAVSTYANPTGDNGRQQRYSYCVSLNRWFREQFRNSGVQLIPTINAGWDTRPIRDGRDPYVKRSPNNDFCEPATPKEIGKHLQETLKWVRANRSFNEANNVLIYAWNEYSEGGWISPTLLEGNARLRAIRQAIDVNRCEIEKLPSCKKQE